MSQWGVSKTFEGERSKIKVVPLVATDSAFDPATMDSTIGMLVLVDINGDRLEAAKIFAGIKTSFEGQKYQTWLD